MIMVYHFSMIKYFVQESLFEKLIVLPAITQNSEQNIKQEKRKEKETITPPKEDIPKKFVESSASIIKPQKPKKLYY